MADHRDTSVAADPIALTARLMSLLPRLAKAISRAGYRELREATGLDYSLIDYQGVLTAAGQFALAWWVDPVRALGAQAELVARSLSLLERQYGSHTGMQTSRPGIDKR